ncbi:MAG: hypothetical protein ACREJO_12720, partial [Phycisphaerales bacterium]
ALPAELLGGFGESRSSARLITRAMRRKRPLWWKAWVRAWQALGVLLAVLVLWYVLMAARFYGMKPTITRNMLKELNAGTEAVPMEQRAWPLYREVFLAVREPIYKASQEMDKWPSIRPMDPAWAAAAAFADDHADEVAKIRRAAAMPRSAFVISGSMPEGGVPGDPGGLTSMDEELNPMGVGILLPQLGAYRQMSRMLAMDARVAASRGDGTRVLADLEAMLGVARHSQEDGTLIAQLVGLAIMAMQTQLVGELLRDQPELFSDAQLTRLAHVLAAYRVSRNGPAEQFDVSLERSSFEDMLQRFYSDDGDGDGRLLGTVYGMTNDFGLVPAGSGSKLVAPAASGFAASRKRTRELFNEIMGRIDAEASRPLWLRDMKAVNEWVDSQVGTPVGRLRHPVLAMVLPAYGRVFSGLDTDLMRRDAATAAIAVELFKRKHGRVPASLEELTPLMLPAVPVDRWAGVPMRYKADGGELTGGRPLIYSVGADRVDDGGVVGTPWQPDAAANNPFWNAPDGQKPTKDWVLWPPIEPKGEAPPIVPQPGGQLWGTMFGLPWPYGN